MNENNVNLSLRLKDDNLILKLDGVSKVFTITNNDTDEVTQLVKLLLERRKEVLDKRRRTMLQEIKNSRKGR